MRHDRRYTNTGPKQRLGHQKETEEEEVQRPPGGARLKKKKRKKESRIGITGRSEIHSSQPRKVERLFEGLMCQ